MLYACGRKMVKLTLIARVADGLPLAEGLDDGRDVPDADLYKQQVKALFKNLSTRQNDASRMSVATGPYIFHYIIEGHVCYLTMCDPSYPKKLAFQYLEGLKNEFERVNGNQIETAARPYAFIKFDTFIQKTKKLFQDTRTQRNISKLNDELYEVHQLVTAAHVSGQRTRPVPPHSISSGEQSQSYEGRFISVKWGEYTKRIGIDGTADAIKEAIKCAFRLRTKRAFWLEDEDDIVRPFDRDMPLGNYILHVDEGVREASEYPASRSLLPPPVKRMKMTSAPPQVLQEERPIQTSIHQKATRHTTSSMLQKNSSETELSRQRTPSESSVPPHSRSSTGFDRPGNSIIVFYQRPPKISKLRRIVLDISQFDCFGVLESVLVQKSGGLVLRRADGTIYLPDIFYNKFGEELANICRRLYSESWISFQRTVSNIFVLRPRKLRARRRLRIQRLSLLVS